MIRKLRALFETLNTPHFDSARVFLNSHGEACKLPITAFNDAVGGTGIENSYFHDLRRTYASRLVMAVEVTKTIQPLMGPRRLI